jgi:hypothetical protein
MEEGIKNKNIKKSAELVSRMTFFVARWMGWMEWMEWMDGRTDVTDCSAWAGFGRARTLRAKKGKKLHLYHGEVLRGHTCGKIIQIGQALPGY